MSREAQEIRRLNRRILSGLETEFAVLKDRYPELVEDLDGSFSRLRKNILDMIGECERTVVEITNDSSLL